MPGCNKSISKYFCADEGSGHYKTFSHRNNIRIPIFSTCANNRGFYYKNIGGVENCNICSFNCLECYSTEKRCKKCNRFSDWTTPVNSSSKCQCKISNCIICEKSECDICIRTF